MTRRPSPEKPFLGMGGRRRPVRGIVRSIYIVVVEHLKDFVGFVYAKKGAKSVRAASEPIGTCFFVRVGDGHGGGHNFLVTARHVWDGLRKGGCVRLNLRTPKPDGVGATYIPLPVAKNRWLFHDREEVDLAVLPWNSAEDVHVQFWGYEYSVRQQEQLQSSRLTWPPKAGDEVVSIAMLAPHPGNQKNIPVVRFGRVALGTAERIEAETGPSAYYVIDGHVLWGSSGCPVWVLYEWTQPQLPGLPPQRLIPSPDKTAFLFGILHGGWPKHERTVFKRRRTDECVVEQYYSIGAGLVTPIEELWEIVTSPKLKERR